MRNLLTVFQAENKDSLELDLHHTSGKNGWCGCILTTEFAGVRYRDDINIGFKV